MNKKTEFLGLIVNQEGIKVGDDRVSVIREWKKPTTINEVCSFIGSLQFFWRIIKDSYQIVAALTNLTRKKE